MPIPVQCSSILYNQGFNTAYDFTVSFTYTMNTSGTNPVNNYGFSVFFIDGLFNIINGGGCEAGLGVASNTSGVQGAFCALGFDIKGEFSKQNSIPFFTTGTATAVPNSIGLRVSSLFTYVSSCDISTANPYLYGPLGPAPTQYAYQTVRVGVRDNFRRIDVHSLNNQTYVKLASFETGLSSVPPIAKMGIGYSGDTLFQVSNITLNYT